MESYIIKTLCLFICLSSGQIASSQPNLKDLETVLFSQPGDIIPGLSTISVVQDVVDILNADTTRQALGNFCSKFGQNTQIDSETEEPGLAIILSSFGLDFGLICEPVLAAVETGSSIEGVTDMCKDIWTSGDVEQLLGFLGGRERKRRSDDEGEDEEDDDAGGEFLTKIFSIFSEYNVPQFIATISGEDLSAESICHAGVSILYNDTITIDQFIEHALDFGLSELAPLMPYLCTTEEEEEEEENGEETDDAVEQIINQIISEFLPENVDITALTTFDPLELIKSIIAHLGRFSNVDDMCTNIAADIPSFTSQAKTTIYSVMSDTDACSGVFDSVESSVNIQPIYDALGISSNEVLCGALVAVLDQSASSNDGFIANIMNAGNLKNMAVVVCEAVIGTESGICNLVTILPRQMLEETCAEYISSVFADPDSIDIGILFSLLNDGLSYIQNFGQDAGMQMSPETIELMGKLGEMMNSIGSMSEEDILVMLNDTIHDRGNFPISGIFVMIEEAFGFEIPIPPELIGQMFDLFTSEFEPHDLLAMLNDTVHDRGNYPISSIFQMIYDTFEFEIPIPPELIGQIFDMVTSESEPHDLLAMINDTIHDRGAYPISAIYAMVQEALGFEIPIPPQMVAQVFDLVTASDELEIEDLFMLLNNSLHDTGPLTISSLAMFMEQTFGIEIPEDLLMAFSGNGVRVDRLLVFAADLLEIPVPSSEQVCYDLDTVISAIVSAIIGSDEASEAFFEQIFMEALQIVKDILPILCYGDESTINIDVETLLNAINFPLPQWITNLWPSNELNNFNLLMPMESARNLIARFGMYKDGDAFCEDVSQMIALDDEEDNEYLDNLVGKMKSSVKKILLNETTCTSILNVVEDVIDLKLYEFIGLESNANLCKVFVPILNTSNIANNSETELLFLGQLFAGQTKELITAVGEGVHGMINEIVHVVTGVSCVGFESETGATQAPVAGDPIARLFSELYSGLSAWDVVFKKPFKIVREVVVLLAGLQNDNALCATENLPEDIADTIKGNVLRMTEDASTCSAIFDTIESEIDIQFVYTLLEISGNSDLCSYIVSIFDGLKDPSGQCADILSGIEEQVDIGFLYGMLGLSGSGQLCEVLVPAIVGFVAEDYDAIDLTFFESPIAAGSEQLVALIQGAADDIMTDLLSEVGLGVLPMFCPGNYPGNDTDDELADFLWSLNMTYTIEVGRAFVTSLGEFGHEEALCATIFNITTAEDGMKELTMLAETMLMTLTTLTEDNTVCLSLIATVENEVDMSQIYELFEIPSGAELCSMIAGNDSIIDRSFLEYAMEFNMEALATSNTEILTFTPFDIISMFAEVEHEELMESCYEIQHEFIAFFPLNGTDMCGILSNINLSNFGHVCGNLMSPFFDIFPEISSFKCSFCDDPFSKDGPFGELQYLLDVRFGLDNILDPYDICSASMEVLVADANEIIDFVKVAGDATVFNITKELFMPTVCQSSDSDDQSLLESMSRIMAVLLEDVADEIAPGNVCMFLESIIASEDEAAARAISVAITSKLFDVFELGTNACVEIADVVSGLMSDMIGADLWQLTGVESHSELCTYIATSFTEDSDPEFPSLLAVYEIFQNPEEILNILQIQDMISLVGSVYASQRSALGVIGLVCDEYGETIETLGVGELLGGFDINGLCTAVKEGDLYHLSHTCRQLIVPLLLPESTQEHDERPSPPMSIQALEHIDIVREIMGALMPLVGAPVWEEPDVVCPAAEELINSQYNPMDIMEVILRHWVPSGIELTAEVCQDWHNIYKFNKPFNYEIAEVAFTYNTKVNRTWQAVANILGIESVERLCVTAIGAVDLRRLEDVKEYTVQRMMSMFEDVGACSDGINGAMMLMNAQGVDFGGMNPIYLYTGYLSAQAFCLDFMDILNGLDPGSRTAAECLGILDCADVCNGDTKIACDGTCGGSSTKDCAGVCGGSAVINECNYCVLGRTRRPAEFGQDKCGVCWSTTNYRQTWDCHGTCNGTAFYDGCKECVGGATGKSANYNNARIDCRGVCDGGWIEDTCGYCEPIIAGARIDPSSGSRYEDCSGACFLPGSSDFAYENSCGVCVGGSTGSAADHGVNACGHCESDPGADESLCSGCDGVPNSGKVEDACGICDGDGTTCFGVGWVRPDFIQENVEITYEAIGAGFTSGATFLCVFIPSSGSQITASASWISVNRLTCTATLPQGEYKVRISKNGLVGDEVEADLTVIASISFTGIDPSDVTLEKEGTFAVTMTAEEADVFAGMTETPHAIVIGAFFATGQIVVEGTFGSDDTSMVFQALMPPISSQFLILPSFDGINALTAPGFDGFQLTFWARAPNLTKIAFYHGGAAMVVHFDSSVEYRSLQTCDAIFSDTSMFGEGARCIWRGTKTVFVIIGSGNNLVNIGDTIELKANSVKAFNQEFSYAASGSAVVEGPDDPVRVNTVLLGTEKITSCGNARMTGRLSQGGAGRPMTFAWSVSSSDGSAASSVATIQSNLDDVSSVDLFLDGSLLDADIPYKFTLTASNFLGESDSASLGFYRSAVAAPEVEIVSKGVDVSQAFVSESFALKAKVTFYADCVPAGETSFSWEVDHEDVVLNLKTATTSTLYVDANSLPGDANITFHLTIFKSSEPDKNVTQSITVATVYSELIPIIKGGDQLTIGRDSGYVAIDGSASFDPDQAAVDMTFSWLCEQATDGTACWSFKEGEEGTTFPNASAASQSVLSFDALSMDADKTYVFTLIVRKGSRSAQTSVTVLALEGDPPQVVIVPVEGKVKADKPLSLIAGLFHKTELATILWETVDTDQGYGYLDLTNEDNLASPIATHDIPDRQSSISFLNIKSGKLTAGSSYVFQLNVTSVDGQYGLAKVMVEVLADITSCSFSLDGQSEYTELDTVTFVTENCAADETAYPLSYQMFVVRDDQGTLEAVSQRQSEPSFTGAGKPARSGTSSNTFVVMVCDKYINCASFDTTVDVLVKTVFSEEEVTALVDGLVTEEKYKLNFLSALVNFNMITTKVGNVSSSRRRRAIDAPDSSTNTVSEQLDLMESIIDSTVLETSTAQLQIDQLQFLDVAEISLADRSRLLDILITLVGVYEADEDESIPDTSADIILDLSGEIRSGLDPTNHASLIEKVSSIESILTQSQVSELSLGGDSVETVSEYLTTSVRLAIPSGEFQTKSSGSNAAVVDFGEDVATRFGANWACSTGSCSGVNIQFEQYETNVDYFSITSEDQNNRAGDIVSISFLDPESGGELSVADLTTPITITMAITITHSNKEYECRYWNSTLSEWASNGLTTRVISPSQVECDTTHLTAFTVIALEPPTTEMVTTEDSEPDEKDVGILEGNMLIIILVCAIAAILLIVVILAIVVCRLKTNNTKRVSPSSSDVSLQDPTQKSAPSLKTEPLSGTPQPLTSRPPPEVVTVPVAMRAVPVSSVSGVMPSHDYASVVNETVPEPMVYIPPPVASTTVPSSHVHHRASPVHLATHRASPVLSIGPQASPVPSLTDVE